MCPTSNSSTSAPSSSNGTSSAENLIEVLGYDDIEVGNMVVKEYYNIPRVG